MNWKTLSLKMWALIAILILAGSIAAIYVYGNYIAEPTIIPTEGIVPPIAAILTADPPTLNWGTVTRGTSTTQLVTLKNISQNTTDLIIDIALTTTGWTNTSDTGLSLTWDYQGTDMYPTQSHTVIFTLSVAPNAPAQTIDFDIVLTPEIGGLSS